MRKHAEIRHLFDLARGLLIGERNNRRFNREEPTMYDRRFFQTRLGQAALASIAAMAAFVALSSQMQAAPAFAADTTLQQVELA